MINGTVYRAPCTMPHRNAPAIVDGGRHSHSTAPTGCGFRTWVTQMVQDIGNGLH